MKPYRKSNTPLYFFHEGQWLIYRKKKEFYEQKTVAELKALVLAQEMAFHQSQDDFSKNRIRNTIIKLKKALKQKTRP